MKFNNYYVADFENTTNGDSTYVYGFGIMNVKDDEPVIVENIEEAMKLLSKIPSKSCVYFHNFASYDGWIILYWLLNNGYKWTEDKNVNKRMTGIITDDRQIYQLKVRFNKCYVEFRDSCKLIQGKLDYIGKNLKCETAKLCGTIDYDKMREEGYRMTEEEKRYLRNDVVLLKEILLKIMQMGNLIDHITAGAYAFSELKDSLYQDMMRVSDEDMEAKRLSKYYKKDMQEHYRYLFPEIPVEIDKDLRRAYRGGYCISWRGEYYEGNGVTLDFNSLYPSCMVNKHLPYGMPIYFTEGVPDCPCFVIHVLVRFKLKEGFLPFIQVKGNPRFVQNEYISNMVNEEIDLWLTSVDYKLFHDFYDVLYEEVIEGYKFKSYEHFFDGFVYRHYEGKKNAKDPVTKQVCKIRLNSAYGKTGSRILRKSGSPYIGDRGNVSLELEETDKYPSATYIPVAEFITAYGRDKILRSAVKVEKNLCYIDTDSLHIKNTTEEEVSKIFELDPKELGMLACEAEWSHGKWVRQKTYVELNVKEDGKKLDKPKLNIKACGLTDEGKEILKGREDVFLAFDFGLKMEGVRLVKRTVEGGVTLCRSDWQIKG